MIIITVVVEVTSTVNFRSFHNYYEDCLKLKEVVAAIDGSSHRFLPYELRARQKQECSSIENETIPMARVDGAFNAFHYQTVEHMRPYFTAFEWANTMMCVA